MILTLQIIHVGTDVVGSVGIVPGFFRSRMIQIPGQIYSGDGGNNFVRNTDKRIPDSMASHSRNYKPQDKTYQR
jgi:hypothetical protein